MNQRQRLFLIFEKLKKAYGAQHWWPAKTAFEVIVGAVLTQNTSWNGVEKAIQNLKKGGLLSFKKLLKVKSSKIAKAIRPAGYFNIKTKRLKNVMSFLQKETSGNLSRLFHRPLAVLRAAFLRVNGVGPETADSILLYAAKKPIFVVDAYTRRILSRIGLCTPDGRYETIQNFFMRNLPERQGLFNEYHALLVVHAKNFCRTKPICEPCPLLDLCLEGSRILNKA